MSKGRPNCRTAQMLTDIDYPGEWFIVNGDNDDTHSQYVENWGRDKVLLFDWAKYVEKSDLLDPFGVENGRPSGAVPARNAIHDISMARGEARHWQLDDDIYTFYEMDDSIGKKVKIEDGNKLYRLMERVARFGLECGFSDIGVDGATWLNGEEARKVTRQVFVCHNLPSDDTFIPWRGRMADDLVQAIDTERTSRGIQLSVKWFGYAYAQSATASGGNTDLYNAEGYIRKAGYINLVGPACCKVGFDEKRKPHIRMSYPAAKIVHEKYQR